MQRLLLALVLLCVGGCKRHDHHLDEIAALKAELAERDAKLNAKIAEIAEKEAKIAELMAVPDAGVAILPPAAGKNEDRRTVNLRTLSAYYESNLPRLIGDLRLSVADSLDEYGHVRDPVRLCLDFHDGFVQKYGADGAQTELIRALGAEVGTQVYLGSLCDGPKVPRGLAPPNVAALTADFATKIEADAVGWSHSLEMNLDELIDDKGHLRDPAGAARREHQILDRKHNGWAHAISLFGNELGTAIYYDRIGTQ